MADLTHLALAVDALLTERALVYGSLPDDAHDLDLLVRRRSVKPLAEQLSSAGFDDWDGRWVRVNGTATHVVEPLDISAWRLPADQVAALFASARPLAGCQHLAEPAPHHRLLIFARRLVLRAGVPEAAKLARMDRAIADDVDAYAKARQEAAAWCCAAQLEVLEDVHRKARAVTWKEAWGGLVAEQKRRGQRVSATPYAARQLLRRPRRGAVVALSGLDGAGKSTQALQLAQSLEALGYDPVIAWKRVTYDPSLDRITAPVRAVLMRSRRSGVPTPSGPLTLSVLPADRQATQALRHRFPWIGVGWVGLVALRHSWRVRRETLAHVRRGRVVIQDRYELDSVVQLRERYGGVLDLTPHLRLVRLLTPHPLAAYFLDVSAAEAWRRKPDEFDQEQLARQRMRYRAELAPVGVECIDGELPASKVAERILLDVWRRLNSR